MKLKFKKRDGDRHESRPQYDQRMIRVDDQKEKEKKH